MKDWTSLANAAGLDIPSQDLARIGASLNALEEAFRPLIQGLTPDMEPAGVFRAEDDQP